jgi:hypothetical protein
MRATGGSARPRQIRTEPADFSVFSNLERAEQSILHRDFLFKFGNLCLQLLFYPIVML